MGALTDIARGYESGVSKAISLLAEKGWLAVSELYSITKNRSWTAIGYPDFRRRFDAVFVSDYGRRFKSEYDNCNELGCDLEALRAAARAYYSAAKNERYVNLDEYVLIGMLSNTAF